MTSRVDRARCGNFNSLSDQAQEARQDLAQLVELAVLLSCRSAASGWRDNKASSELHSPDLCFGLALSFFVVVVAVSMELLGTGCAFLWVRLKHMP